MQFALATAAVINPWATRLWIQYVYTFFFWWRGSPQWARASALSRLRDRTQTHHTP
jgi:hypothetical protein